MDTETRDDDAPTVSAYPRQAPDVGLFGRAVEDCESPPTWDEEWAPDECGRGWQYDDFDVGDDAGPQPCWRCGGTDHLHDYCPQIPF